MKFFFQKGPNKRSVTLIELVVVMGIVAILFTLSSFQAFRIRDRSNLKSASTQLISLIRKQQLNSMNTNTLYGVFFEPTQYTLFSGSEYSAINQENTVVLLDYPIQLTQILFPSSEILFASGSGEIVGFDNANHSVLLKDIVNNEEKFIELNSLGVPTSIQ